MNIINKNRLIVLGMFVLFFLSRVAFLDRDLPPWDVSNYAPIDELYYSLTAFNIYHYGDVGHKDFSFVESDSTTENLFGNMLTAMTLFVFGNNYYGLRMSSVLASLLCFFAMFFAFKGYLLDSSFALPSMGGCHWLEKNKSDFFAMVGLFFGVYILCDFSFLVASRVMETTIFRIVPVVSFLWYFSSLDMRYSDTRFSPWNPLLVGFFATLSVFYVYPTNFFLIPALFVLYAFVGSWSMRTRVLFSLLFLLGGGLAFLSYEFVLRILFNKSYLEVLSGTYTIFTGRLVVDPLANDANIILSLVKKIVRNGFGIVSTNFLRVNVFLLFASLMSVPVFMWMLYRFKLLKDLALLCVCIMFVGQTLIINDYFYRKLIVMFPLVLLVIARSVTGLDSFCASVVKNRKYTKICFVYLFFSFLIAFGVLVANGSSRVVGYDALNEAPLLFFIFVAQLSCFGFALKKSGSSLFRPLVWMLAILLLVPNIFFSFKYVYLYPTYSYKEAMISMGDIVNEKVVSGGWSHGFRLYNTSIPVLNPYKYQYTEEGFNSYFDAWNKINELTGDGLGVIYNPPCSPLEERIKSQSDVVGEFVLEDRVRGVSPVHIHLLQLKP